MSLLEIENLTVSFRQSGKTIDAVRGVSLRVEPGESLGIVGESGSGKSVSCMAALRLLREPPAIVRADRLRLDGVDMLSADRKTLWRR
ncbi:ATP-binding cassette domain-containing protein [Devosia sp.]|uniref:ATP-binding cassette domain-containing protein n=1 Tax=Devosia sp. TaxID=1871048 RepID=UPI002AFFB8C6|nr:ATP-binding cassette domain-containing protein [Devosia sp.]